MASLPLDIPVIDAHVHAYPEETARRLRVSFQAGRAAGTFAALPEDLGTTEDLVKRLAQVSKSKASGAILKSLTPTAEMAMTAWGRLESAPSGEEARRLYDSVKEQVAGRIRRRNAWGNQVSKQYPTFANFITLDPHFMTPAENVLELELRLKEGAKGIGLHPTRNRHLPEDRRLYLAYERAEELDVPIIFHTGLEPITYAYMGLYAEPNDFRYFLEDFPRLRVIFGHFGEGYIDQIPDIAARYPNVWFETSGTAGGHPPYHYSDEELVRLIRRVGPDRVMFGSDWIFGDIPSAVQRVINLPLTDDEKEGILYKNAQEFLDT